MLGISICAHSQELGIIETCITRGHRGGQSWGGQRFWVMEDGKDSAARPSQRTYLVESSAEMSAECCQPTHRRQESKKRTRKSSKVESTYWRVFTSQVFFFSLPLTQQCTISDTCSAHPTHMRNTHRHTDAWRSMRHHTHVYS